VNHVFEYVRSDHRPVGDEVGSDGMPVSWGEFDLWRCACCGAEVWAECLTDYDPDDRLVVLHGCFNPYGAIKAEGRAVECPEDLATVYEVMTR
jgi:hypothetical protein